MSYFWIILDKLENKSPQNVTPKIHVHLLESLFRELQKLRGQTRGVGGVVKCPLYLIGLIK